jgi:hypothetical protein
MTFIVEMLRNIDTGKSPAEFRCDGDSWKKLLAVAEKFGLQPKGTIPGQSFANTYSDQQTLLVPDSIGNNRLDTLEDIGFLKRRLFLHSF